MAIKRVLITAGGTGGHLYPAQGLAQQLIKKLDPSAVLFVAGGLNTSRYFDRTAFAFQEVACHPLVTKNPIKFLKGLNCLVKGMMQSRQILKNYQPDVVVGFGSYYTVSTLLAAKSLGIPILLHEANSIPGQANQWLSKLAHTVALHFPSTASLMKGKAPCIEVGLPLREGYSLEAVNKNEALNYFQLGEERQTWLVCGGSQGARAINDLMKQVLPILNPQNIQVIHLTGDPQASEELKICYANAQIPACVKPFEKRMDFAWRAADAFVGRAGASTIAEAMEFEVPGILIPYPFATHQHQEKNADFLVETVQAAYKTVEQTLTPQELALLIHSLTKTTQLDTFRTALQQYKQRPHRIDLCQLIFKMGDS